MSLGRIIRHNEERKVKKDVFRRFKECNALDENSAVTLEQLGISTSEDSVEKDHIDFLLMRVVVEQIGDKYWYDEVEMKKQTRQIAIFTTITIAIAVIVGIYMSITS